MKKYLAIDMGGTAIKYGVLDEDLNFSEHGKITAVTDSQESVFKDIQKLYSQFGKEPKAYAFRCPV